jgi:release factor glutamine methyltransferase
MDFRSELRRAKREFCQSGLPELDAELLLAHALGITRMELHNTVVVAKVLKSLDDATEVFEQFEAMCARRLGDEPVQYITGVANFCDLTLQVGRGVLIPRPETELLIENIVLHLRALTGQTSVIDLGAGSGAIAIAIASQVPTAHVIAVENDADALVWLRKNIEASDVDVRIVPEDVSTALVGVRADLVVANPPYIPDDQDLPIEVMNFEPHSALFGGKEGMDAPRAFIAAASRLLKDEGIFVMEHGEAQAYSVEQALSDDFTDIRMHTDLTNRPRWTSAQRIRRGRLR